MEKAIFLVVVLAVISCQQTKQIDPTSEEYQAEVKQQIAQVDKLFYEAWENKDLDSVFFLLMKNSSICLVLV